MDRPPATMKSEALKYLESHFAIGHINVQEFSALHDLLAIFNRLAKLVRRTSGRDIDWDTGKRLILEDAARARKHLQAFTKMYVYTFNECEEALETNFHPFAPGMKEWVAYEEKEFKNDIERLPGTKDLFDLISDHYDETVYFLVLQLHRQRPDHPIWELQVPLTAIYAATNEVYNVVSEAAWRAQWLAEKIAEYHRSCKVYGVGSAVEDEPRLPSKYNTTEREPDSENIKSPTEANDSNEIKSPPAANSSKEGKSPPAVSNSMGGKPPPGPNSSRENKPPPEPSSSREIMQPPPTTFSKDIKSPPAASSCIIREELPSHPYGTSKSFGASEEAVTRRPIAAKAARSARAAGEAADGHRRSGHLPRIFTGSFNELEEGMLKLRIPEAEISPVTQIALRDPNMLTETVTTPVSGKTPISVYSSPGLRRREALIERDVEFQDRLIHGGVIRSRRPVESEAGEAGHPQLQKGYAFEGETLSSWLNDAPDTERKASPSDVPIGNAL